MSGGHSTNLIINRKLSARLHKHAVSSSYFMENLKGFEKVTDYAWIKKGKKYWNVWLGNPFCISLYKAPLSIPKEEIEIDLVKGQQEAKMDFVKRFPDVDWVG